MSINQLSSYSVHDFLTRLVPGAIVSLSIGALSQDLVSAISTLNPLEILILLAVFYIAGEIVEYGRVRIISYPITFGRTLFAISRNPSFLSPTDKIFFHLILRPKNKIFTVLGWRTTTNSVEYYSVFDDSGDDLMDQLFSHFNLKEDSISSIRLYKLLLSYMDPYLSIHARRMQRTYIFFQNIKISAGLVIIYAIFYTLADYPKRFEGLISPSIIIIVMALIFMYAITIFSSIDEEYVDTLLVEYYEEVNSS